MILVDDRAGSKDLLHHPPLSDPSLALATRLDSADVAFEGRDDGGSIWIGIEVKSLFDLISSSDTGRLQATQIPAMAAEYDLSYLLYYGVHRPDPRTGHLQIKKKGRWTTYSLGSRPVPASYVSSVLLGIQRAGVHVIHVPHIGPEAIRVAAWEVGAVYAYWQKQKHSQFRCFDKTRELTETDYRKVKGVGGNLPVPIDKREFQRARFAAQFPGIGFEKAVEVAKRFRSPRAMFNATVEEWMEVDGIGKTLARTAVQVAEEKG